MLLVIIKLHEMYFVAFLNADSTRIWDRVPYPGMVRLQGGTHSSEGHVQVYCNGQWGAICDAGFGPNDAHTVCKQLGYSNYTSYSSSEL